MSSENIQMSFEETNTNVSSGGEAKNDNVEKVSSSDSMDFGRYLLNYDHHGFGPDRAYMS